MEKEDAINDLLLRLGPSGTALLDWLRPLLDDSHLREIALVDYGFNEDENFQALQRIHQGHPIPIPLRWVPREALELVRWSNLDDPQHLSPPPNHKGIRAHLLRAFCCAILLKAADAPETLGNIDTEIDTLGRLVVSILYLGKEASESALRFLYWRVSRLSKENEDRPFFAMAVLLLYASLFKPGQDSHDLILLTDWVIAEEAQTRVDQGEFCDSEKWLLGLNVIFNQSHNIWRRVAQEVLLDPAKAFPEPAATTMRDIAKRLSG